MHTPIFAGLGSEEGFRRYLDLIADEINVMLVNVEDEKGDVVGEILRVVDVA